MGEDWYHDPSLFMQEMNGCIDVKITNQVDLMGKPIIYKLKDAGLNFDVLNVESNKPTLQASKVSSQVFSQGDVVYHPNLKTSQYN